VAVTVSEPSGAFVAVQEPDPALRVAVQSVAPAVNVTVPAGVPVEPAAESATVAEKVTLWPDVEIPGVTTMDVELDASFTVSAAVPEDPPKLASPE
jgi:hypothetical protein